MDRIMSGAKTGRPGHLQAAILSAFDGRQLPYLMGEEITERSGLHERVCAVVRCNLVRAGVLHVLKGWRSSRYYLSATDMEYGRTDFEVHQAKLLVERNAARKANERERMKRKRANLAAKPRAQKQPKMTPARKAFNGSNDKPKAQQMTKPKQSRFNPDATKRKDDRPVVIPPHVKVQRIPGFERFGSPQAAKWQRQV
jgi:hypothetical protein